MFISDEVPEKETPEYCTVPAPVIALVLLDSTMQLKTCNVVDAPMLKAEPEPLLNIQSCTRLVADVTVVKHVELLLFICVYVIVILTAVTVIGNFIRHLFK